MARKPEEEANHWPGFVDALSTIVMVITFLLILLGLTLFIMMQKIQADANTSTDTQVVSEAVGGDQTQDEVQVEIASASAANTSQVSELQEKLEQAQQEIEKLKTQTQQMAGAPEAPEGQSIASMGAELKQKEQIETENKLTILTRKTDDKVKVAIASDEPATSDGEIKVTSAAVALELNYDEQTTKLDDAAAQQVGDYFQEQMKKEDDGVFEIRSIASSGVGSISEARRKAYFRALTVRNILLKRGVPPARISTKIAFPQPGEDDDRVIVSMKPR